MPAEIETRVFFSPLILGGPKNMAPENKDIEFAPNRSINTESEKKLIEAPKVVEESPGRPKNVRLSALAAKRNASRAKRSTSSTSTSTPGDARDEAKVVQASQDAPKEGALLEEQKPRKKKFDISPQERLELGQNISHMVSQIQPDAMMTSNIIGLTQGLRCNARYLHHRHKQPSRGMKMLFPGKDKNSRAKFVFGLMHSLFDGEYVDEAILKPREMYEKLIPFDFSSCPNEAVATAERKEMEAAKMRRKHHKRLVATDLAAAKSQKKNHNLDIDPLVAKRCLKNRLKETAEVSSRSLVVVVCGEPSSGKSTLVSSLLGFCEPSSFSEKQISKVKWEAEKAGRPRDHLAWLVDELPAERRCGHSWDLTDASVKLPSGLPCNLLDCPGNQFPLLSDLAVNAHAFVMVLDTTRAAAGDAEMRLYIRDSLRVMMEQSNWLDSQLIVVLNQMDRCNYSTGLANKAKSYFTDILSETTSNDNLKHAIFVPACALTGDGLVPSGKKPRPDNGRVSFNTCLIDILENVKFTQTLMMEPQPIDLKSPVLLVRDVYENMGAGFTAVAVVMQGLVTPGQSCVCFPSRASLTVRSVQLLRTGRLVAVKCATVGETVHIVLWQVEMAAVKRGSIICHPLLSPDRSPDFKEDCVQIRQHFECQIEIVNLHGRSLYNGRQVVFHSFASSLPAFISRILWVSFANDHDVSTNEVKLKPMAVSRAGSIVGVELILESSHACIPSLDIGLKFSLMVNDSLMATGIISKVLEDGPAVDALRVHDCYDPKRLLFHRSGDNDHMEVD